MTNITMIQVLWGFSILLLSLMLLGVLYNSLTAPRLEKGGVPHFYPLVSLLIPARNEENNLRILLPLLEKLDYPALEVLILDDNSQDATASILANNSIPNLKVLSGKSIPEGWLGKNWACQQLANAAQGEILIFCDADVRIGEKAIEQTIAWMEKLKLDALTCLPHQIQGSWAEKSVLPVLLLVPVLGFFPIAQIYKRRSVNVSVGCGQWFAFKTTSYIAMGQHASVKYEVVEDIALGKRVKICGLRLGAMLSSKQLQVRMYNNVKELWEGFGKNLFVVIGKNPLTPFLILIPFTLINILPWAMVLMGQCQWLWPLSLLIIIRIWVAKIFGEKKVFNILWQPVGALLIPIIGAKSWIGYHRNQLVWKGRVLDLKPKNKPVKGKMI